MIGERTIEMFEAALTFGPDNHWALSWYALALSDRGMFEQAEERARRAVERHPAHSILLTNLARVLLASGVREKRQEAEILLKKARDTAPVGFRYPQELLAELETR